MKNDINNFFDVRTDWRTRFYFNWLLPIQIIVFFIGCIWFYNNSKVTMEDLSKGKGEIVDTYYLLQNGAIDTCLIIVISNGHELTLNNDMRKKYNNLTKSTSCTMVSEYLYRKNKRGKIIFYKLSINGIAFKEITISHVESRIKSMFMGFLCFLSIIGLIIYNKTSLIKQRGNL